MQGGGPTGQRRNRGSGHRFITAGLEHDDWIGAFATPTGLSPDDSCGDQGLVRCAFLVLTRPGRTLRLP